LNGSAVLGVIATAVMLAGCSVSGLGSMFGSAPEVSSWEASVSEESLLAAAKYDAADSVAVDSMVTAHGCPRFTAPASGKRLTIYEIGRTGDGLAIIHRGEISKTARECNIGTNSITVKYGFAGRVLLGPKGRAGSFNLPVIIHLSDRDNNNVKTEKLSIPVNVPQDKPYGYFSTVKNLSFKIPQGASPGSYKMQVLFDHSVPGAG